MNKVYEDGTKAAIKSIQDRDEHSSVKQNQHLKRR